LAYPSRLSREGDAEMDWNKLGAIGSLGSFLIGGMLFAVQVWPIPQIRARREVAPEGEVSPRLGPKAVGIFLILGFLLSGFSIYGAWYPRQPVPVTQENIEKQVKTWLEEFNYSVKKINDENYYFAFEAGLPDGRHLVVRRSKKRDHYLFVVTEVALSAEDARDFANLSSTQQAELTAEIGLEMSRERVEWALHLPDPISLMDTVPITPNLTADDLVKTIGNVDGAVIGVSELVRLKMLTLGAGK